MSFTIFSFMIALLWCNLYIAAIALIRKRDQFILYFSCFPLLLLIFASVCRVVLPVEFPHTVVITSKVIMTTLYGLFTAPLVTNSEGIAIICVSHILAAIWVMGSVWFLLCYVYQLIRLKKTQNGFSTTQDTHILSLMDEIALEHGYDKKIEIVQSPEITTPIVIGFFYPTIYLPDLPLADAELKHILGHELAHFLHKDAWIKLFMYMIVSIFWWNPFVHFLSRDLNHILEIRCDLSLAVKMSRDERAEYLDGIIKVMKRMRRIKTPLIMPADATGLAILSSRTKIEQRFHLVMEYEPKKRRHIAFNALLSALIVFFVFISYTFVIQPGYSADQYGGENTYLINPENSYLTTNEDGTYSVYVDGQYTGDINDNSTEPFSSMPIK